MSRERIILGTGGLFPVVKGRMEGVVDLGPRDHCRGWTATLRIGRDGGRLTHCPGLPIDLVPGGPEDEPELWFGSR